LPDIHSTEMDLQITDEKRWIAGHGYDSSSSAYCTNSTCREV
jgi:hypothetical protein